MHLSLLHDAGDAPEPQPPRSQPQPQDLVLLEGEDWGDVTGLAPMDEV